MNPFTTYMIAFLVAGLINAFAIDRVRVYDISFISGEMLSSRGYTSIKCGEEVSMEEAARFIEEKNNIVNVVVMEMKERDLKYKWRFISKGESE